MMFLDGIKKFCSVVFTQVPRCLICRNAVSSAGYPFCENCSEEYSKLICTPCGECGKTVAECDCVEVPPCIRFYRLFEYEGEAARSIIYCLKRRGAPVDYRCIAQRLKERITNTSGEKISFDCISYVPRNKKGVAFYGYDHAKMLAKCLAELFGVECKKLLVHTGAKGEQKRLNRLYRGFAAKTRFSVNEKALNVGKLPFRRVLLADDMVTTGNTMGECARILKSCGVKQVFGVAVGHTPGKTKNRRRDTENGRSF